MTVVLESEPGNFQTRNSVAIRTGANTKGHRLRGGTARETKPMMKPDATDHSGMEISRPPMCAEAEAGTSVTMKRRNAERRMGCVTPTVKAVRLTGVLAARNA